MKLLSHYSIAWKTVVTILGLLLTWTSYGQTLEVELNSTLATPHLNLVEQGNDFSRIKMQNTPNPTRYWDLAGRSNPSNDLSLFNFYYFNGSTGVDHLTITGSGRVGVGNTAPQATLDVNGYTRLGIEQDSPEIKTKRIFGTTPAAGSSSLLPHGLSGYEKMLAVHVLVEDNLDGVFFYSHRETIWNDDTNVAVSSPIGNSRNYKMFIIYEK